MKTSRIVRGTVEGLGWGVLALIIVAIVTIFVDKDQSVFLDDY